MATVTTNMLNQSRMDSLGATTQAALSDISTFFETDLQALSDEIATNDAPLETVTNSQITLDFQMGSQFFIKGSNLLNLSNGTLNPYTITQINITSSNNIVFDLRGSVTYNPTTHVMSGSLTSLDITSSWFSANLDISASSIYDDLFVTSTQSFTFSHIDLTIPSMVAGGTALQLSLDGAMTADNLGLSGNVTGMTVTSGGSSFVATGLNGNLANLSNATDADHLLSMLLSGADSITGTSGNDHLRGYNGNDKFFGNAGVDIITGDYGADTLNGGDGNDKLDGGNGNDVLNGGNGSDYLFGGLNADKLFGNGGNDFLIGGSDTANDTLDGGVGIDTVNYSATYSADVTGVTVDLRNSTTIQNTIRAGNDLIKGVENVVGSDYNDTLTGNAANNMLNGGMGNDKLTGNDGNDRLIGYDGNDTLAGGNGNDLIFGGDGKDLLTGGTGSDVFYFDSLWDSLPGTNRDTITDFVHGVDKINLRWIDANQILDGEQAFDATIASGAGFTSFSGIGKLYFDTTNKILYGNNDGDIQADFSIKLNNVTTLTGSDFVL